MLLWLQPIGFDVGGDGPNSSIHSGSSSNTISSSTDDGEKGSKIRQRRRQAFGRQLLQILFATTVAVSTMSVFIVKYQHSPKIRGHVRTTTTSHHDHHEKKKHHPRHQRTIEKTAVQVVPKEINSKNSNVNVPNIDTLPVNSIYRLSMKDANGIVQSLSQYIGMVTLVVNTACK